MHRVFPLAGVSLIALSSAALAQDAAISQNPGTIVLDPITLVADGQENIEATGGVVVSQSDLEAIAPTDISDVFSRDSAVSVSAGGGPSKRVHVFGIEQSNLAVSVDGVPQFGDNWHHSGSNVIDPALLKRVTVDAGTAPADAGFGAGAGAIRYETVDAYDLLTDGRKQGGRVGLSYGSNGRGLSANIAGYGVYEGFDWFAMLHTAQGDNYDNGNGEEIFGSETAVSGGLLKLGYEFETHRVELNYEHTEDDADRFAKMNFDLLREDGAVYPLKVTRDTFSLRYTSTAPTANWDPEALIYINRNEYDRPNYIENGTNGDMNMQAEGFGGVLKNRFDMGPGTITAGVDFSYDDYTIDNYETGAIIGRDGNPTGEDYVQIHNLETAQIGTFVQGRFEFSNGFDVSTGLRLDHSRFTDWNGQKFTDSGASVNGTVSYEFTPGYEIFAGASRTWLGYDIGEYGYLHARGSNTKTEPDFEASTSENYKIGFNASQENWTGNITFFDTRIDNLPNDYYYDTADGREILNFDNDDKEYRSKGVTLQGNYSWGSGRVGASITAAKLTADGEKILPDGGDLVPVGEVASIYVDQEFSQYNLKLGGNVEIANKITGDYLTEAGFDEPSGYGIVNAYAEWRPEQYENIAVQLNVDNLFDKNYYERSSYVENDLRGGGIDPIYAPGRTVSLGVKMDF